jgi:restriction endonuclease S subunit
MSKNWKKVKLGDVVANVNRTSKEVKRIERIVGLEHLDPSDLHIRRWETPENGTSFTRAFKKGQTLFGKRRAYQRKVAYAEFAGICSGDILTFESKDQCVLLPELLPFLCTTDCFYDYALDTSAGSLSPRTSWKALKDFEFLLPPIDEQKKIAEILWATDEAIEKYLSYKKSLDMLYETILHKHLFTSTLTKVKIGDLGSINRKSLSEKATPAEYTFKYIDIGSVIAPRKLGTPEVYRFENSPSRARRCVQNGDILVSTVRPNLKSFVRLSNIHGNFIASTGFAVITPNNATFGSLIYHSIFSKQFENYCNDRVTGTNYPTISAKDIGKFEFSLPNDLVRVAKELDSIEEIMNKTETHIDNLHNLKTKLVNKLIQGGASDVQ